METMDTGSEERFQRVERALEQLQETAVVVAGIQARQAEALKNQTQWLESLQMQEARHADFIARHEMTMSEIDGKLNALIDIVDHLGRRDRGGRND